MAKVTPQEAADKQIRRLSAATADITRGINRVTEAPGAKAAAKQSLMQQKINESIDSGKWARNVAGVSLQEWKTAAVDKGVSRIAPGISAARGKLERFHSQLLPAVDAAAAEVNAMPKGTIEDSVNRAAAFIRRMSEFSFDKTR